MKKNVTNYFSVIIFAYAADLFVFFCALETGLSISQSVTLAFFAGNIAAVFAFRFIFRTDLNPRFNILNDVILTLILNALLLVTSIYIIIFLHEDLMINLLFSKILVNAISFFINLMFRATFLQKRNKIVY